MDDDSPEHSSATANTVAAAGPSSGPSVRYACSTSVTTARLCEKNATAAITIIAELISHAPFIATNTSISSKRRKLRRREMPLTCGMPMTSFRRGCTSAECR